MSSRQTAVINGLLAENFGKNDLIRNAESISRQAVSKANEAEREADNLRLEAGSLASRIRYLERQLEHAKGMQRKAEIDADTYKKEADSFRDLLSKPMKEIADMSGDFKKTYELQQQMLAEWIMGQKAFKETAMQLGMQVGKSPEEVQQMATQNANAVLDNRTQFGNDGSASPTLAEHASAIIAMRKKNGKY
jgi:hypothetical protein